MIKEKFLCLGIGALFSLAVAGTAVSAEVLKMSTTTSTQASGLLDLLLPDS